MKELLSSLYRDVTIRVNSAVPQSSIDDAVMLHVNGIMEKKSTRNRRAFAQVFLLFPQENGYFIQTDVAHVMAPTDATSLGKTSLYTLKFLIKHILDTLDDGETSMSALTGCQGQAPLRLGTYNGAQPEQDTSNVLEPRTRTPPLEDSPHVVQTDAEVAPQPQNAKPSPWIIRPPGGSSSVSHTVNIVVLLSVC